MNKEELDYWLKFFCNKSICYKSGEDKKISFAKVFMEFKELQQENEQLKTNWIKLKEYIEIIYKGCPQYEKEVVMFIIDKMQKIEESDE